MARKLIAADLFCGGGGTSTGMAQACKAMDAQLTLYAFNHNKHAMATHAANHPWAHHCPQNLDAINPQTHIRGGRLHMMAASPECTNHSRAKAGRPLLEQSRATAYHVARWTDTIRVDHFLIENVPEFMDWGPVDAKGKPIKRMRGSTFRAYLEIFRSQNFHVEHRIINSADYGALTARKRLFIMGKRGSSRNLNWPDPTHDADPDACLFGGKQPYLAARGCIDRSIRGKTIFGRKRPLSPNTLRRILAGLFRYGKGLEPFMVQLTHGGRLIDMNQPLPTITGGCRGDIAFVEPFLISLKGTSDSHLESCQRSLDDVLPSFTTNNQIALIEPYLVKYYGTALAASIDEPLDTVTGTDRFGLVQPTLIESGDGKLALDIHFRMLAPHELATAMGFPSQYIFCGNRTQKIKQIGNAVEVNTARALTMALLG